MLVTVLNGAPERVALDVENTRSSSSAKDTDQTYVTTAGGRDCDSSETKTSLSEYKGGKNTSGEMEWLSGERDLDR